MITCTQSICIEVSSETFAIAWIVIDAKMTSLHIPLLCELFHSPGLCKGLFLAVSRGDKKNPINFFPQSWPKKPGPVCVNIAQFWRKHLTYYKLPSRCFSKGWEWACHNIEYHPRKIKVMLNKWINHLWHVIYQNVEINIKIRMREENMSRRE